jgi:hypothetical protein
MPEPTPKPNARLAAALERLEALAQRLDALAQGEPPPKPSLVLVKGGDDA